MAAAKKSPAADSATVPTGKLPAATGKPSAAATNSPVAPGAFITVEGADGAGKTTHLDFIERHLRSHGHAVTRSREPGGTALGERLRGLLLGGPDADADAAISDRAELLLVFAARAQHLDEVIAPALAAGRWVLCDRFTDATYAYQGGGRGLDARAIAVLEQWTHGELQPDLTLLLDVPVEVGQARTRRREQAEQGGDRGDGADGADRFERESTEFKQAVRAAYLARAAQFPARIKRIDAAVGIAQVRAELQTVLDAFDRARQTGKPRQASQNA
ncbi:MAG: dTMP kinase [Gammaproteobacteria bacterium]|nr:dTMP kinase [Gammaproteobacteria bacterium]